MLAGRTLASMFYISVLWIFVATAQDFTPSSSWRKPTITISPEQRENIASAALEEAIDHLNSAAQFDGESYGSAGALYSQMAEFDLLFNQTKYRDQLKSYFPLAEQARSSFLDEFVYGYAATKAYVAYKDEEFLTYAEISWNSGNEYTLSDDNVASQSMPFKNFPISSSCQGISMAGGTFHSTDPNDATLVGLGTGSFLILSAALYEATNNQTYLEAANKSLNFIHAHLYNVQNVVQDQISAMQNASCSTSNTIFSYNAGLMIEGMAILASITNDTSTQQLLESTVSAALSNDIWQGQDGVLRTGDAKLVNALMAVYNHNTISSAMQNYVKDYLGVQYNAVIEMATENNSNIYGSSWIGPPSSKFDSFNQTQALGVLIGAISLTNDTIPNSSPTSSPASPSATNIPPGPKPQSKSGIIIGSILGSLAFVVFLGCMIWFFLKRKHHNQRDVQCSPFGLDSDQDLQVQTQLPLSQAASSIPAIHSHLKTQTTAMSQSTPSQPSLSQQHARKGHQTTDSSGLLHLSGPSVLLSQPHLDTMIPLPMQVNNQETSGQLERNIQRGNPGNNMTTAELVQMLNERLQPGQWTDDEQPPEYPESSSGR
ncbi:hypothetical protein K435DRAFT_962088 [Dendrothele bispora CBS 962.96]|uniref:Glycoside hydrolase family 76 protein n=1 Tax=Dendrothele bispora (strain CBS 962.96) TaxID=1314807 RepID=A0A4S8MN48_DENBC|nr:hypothetical protein K435DRAFT_962088 [Dendrothele bispora CBS 962.96]